MVDGAMRLLWFCCVDCIWLLVAVCVGDLMVACFATFDSVAACG